MRKDLVPGSFAAHTIAVFILVNCASIAACGGSTPSATPPDGGSLDAPRADGAAIDTAPPCFPCEGYWICGGSVERIDLTPSVDGCYLSGLPDRTIISPDGTIIVDGGVVALATGSGARVHVTYPDGGLWLFCAAGGGCRSQ
jgi:hypothetical protein